MPSNYTHICVKCKSSRRSPKTNKHVCCDMEMIALTEKWRIPTKNDKKGWENLYIEISKNPWYRDKLNENGVNL